MDFRADLCFTDARSGIVGGGFQLSSGNRIGDERAVGWDSE